MRLEGWEQHLACCPSFETRRFATLLRMRWVGGRGSTGRGKTVALLVADHEAGLADFLG